MTALRLEGISKHFGAIHALDDVSLSLHAGEVLGLMGDNGAGKSTLVKIIAGNFRPTHGKICIKDQELVFHGPLDARQHGVGGLDRRSLFRSVQRQQFGGRAIGQIGGAGGSTHAAVSLRARRGNVAACSPRS